MRLIDAECCRDAPNDYNFCPNCGALMLDEPPESEVQDDEQRG